MGYYLTTTCRERAAGGVPVSPKTHTPLPRVKERGYRSYSPDLGRWLSRDPIGEQGGANLLALHGNNSLSAVDALGLATRDVDSVLSDLIDYTGDWREGNCRCYAGDLRDAIRGDSVLAAAIVGIAGRTHSSGRPCLERIRCARSCPHVHCSACSAGTRGEYWLPLQAGSSAGGVITICSDTDLQAGALRGVIAHELQHAGDCGFYNDSCNTQAGCIRMLVAEIRAHIAGDTSAAGRGRCRASVIAQGDAEYSYCVEEVLGSFVSGAPSSAHNPCAGCRTRLTNVDNGDLGNLAWILVTRGLIPGRGDIARGVILPPTP